MNSNLISDVKCIICNKKFEFFKLREHIGVLIVLTDLINSAKINLLFFKCILILLNLKKTRVSLSKIY